jgi:YggT family protein
MFILGNLLAALASVIGLVLNLYMWIIIARAVISWVNPDPYNPIVRFLYSITDPVLLAIRRRLPLSFGGIFCRDSWSLHFMIWPGNSSTNHRHQWRMV